MAPYDYLITFYHLTSLAAKYLSTVSRPIALITKHLEPIIEERRKKAEEYNPEYTDTPACPFD